MKGKPIVITCLIVLVLILLLLGIAGQRILRASDEISPGPPSLIDLGAICPEWGWQEAYVGCTDCHNNKPKEVNKTIFNINSDFCWVENKTVYFDFNTSISNYLYTTFRNHIYAINDIEYNKIVILLKSFGGGYFDSLAVVHIIEELQKQGKTVEIRVHGNAVSGGFVVLLAGDTRLASKTVILMWHEIMSATFLRVFDTSDSEHEAEMMRFLQDNMNKYIADHSKLTKEELDERVRFKDLYVTGEEGLKLGFIDGYLK